MERCGAKTRSGGACGKPAGWGTQFLTGRCSLHGGATPTHVVAAEKEMACRTCERFGVSVAIGPAEALLEELARSHGLVLFYESLVRQLPTHPDADAYIPTDDRGHCERGEAGLYGRMYHGTGIPTGEARPHVLVGLYNAERKHYKGVAAAALSAGVAQRVIELAEGTARQVVGVLSDFATRLGLDPASPEVREAGRAALTVAAGSQPDQR
jgi:hypothetical protein